MKVDNDNQVRANALEDAQDGVTPVGKVETWLLWALVSSQSWVCLPWGGAGLRGVPC
jgi:hypothetical protein